MLTFFLHDVYSFSLITDTFYFFFGGHYLSSVSVQNHCQIVLEHLFLVILSVLNTNVRIAFL